MMRSAHDRLAKLADPPGYMAHGTVADLYRDAERACGQFPSR